MNTSSMDTRDTQRGGRFTKGDRIRVLDAQGAVLCVGEALHTRDFVGAALFQVWTTHGNSGWAYEYNLNYVRVELVT